MQPSRLQHVFFTDVGDFREILDALELLNDALFMIKNRESRYIYMSQSLRKAIGLQRAEEVVGFTDFDLFPRIVAQSYRDNDLQVLEHGKTLVNEIHAAGFIEGVPEWFFSSKYPLHGRNGDVIGLLTLNERYDTVMGNDDEMNRLLPAIEYMSNQYGERIMNVELAERCNMSESHFMRVFKEAMNMTAQEFLERVRMFHAIDALKHTANGIAHIAVDCGFYDHSSFVKRFKKFTGITPLQYRKNYKQGLRSDPAMALPPIT